jgi:hypothetical protein
MAIGARDRSDTHYCASPRMDCLRGESLRYASVRQDDAWLGKQLKRLLTEAPGFTISRSARPPAAAGQVLHTGQAGCRSRR